jgi:hypothetical protein
MVDRAVTGGHSTRSRCDAGIVCLAGVPTRPTVRIAFLPVQQAEDAVHGGRRRRLGDELRRQRFPAEPSLDHLDMQLPAPAEPCVPELGDEGRAGVRHERGECGVRRSQGRLLLAGDEQRRAGCRKSGSRERGGEASIQERRRARGDAKRSSVPRSRNPARPSAAATRRVLMIGETEMTPSWTRRSPQPPQTGRTAAPSITARWTRSGCRPRSAITTAPPYAPCAKSVGLFLSLIAID